MDYTKLVEEILSERWFEPSIGTNVVRRSAADTVEQQAKRIAELEAQLSDAKSLLRAQGRELGEQDVLLAQPAQSVPDGLIDALKRAQELSQKSAKIDHEKLLGRTIKPFVTQLLTAAPKPEAKERA